MALRPLSGNRSLRVLPLGAESWRSLEDNPLPSYPLTILWDKRGSAVALPAPPPQPPPRPGPTARLAAPGSPAALAPGVTGLARTAQTGTLLQPREECGSLGRELNALARLLTNLQLPRAPPPPPQSGSCPPNPVTPLHPAPRPADRRPNTGLGRPKGFRKTKDLWSNFPRGGRRRLPGPCTPTPGCSPGN